MKRNKLENNITFLIVSIGIFLLNFKALSLISIIPGSIISYLIIKLLERINIFKFKLFNILLLIISIFISFHLLNKITYFISDNILQNYSTILISITLLILIIFLIKKGYHTIIKVILISSYFIFLFLLLGIFFNLFYLDFKYLNITILTSNNLIKESLYYSFLIVYSYLIIYPLNHEKLNIKSLFIPCFYHLFTYFLIILVLGPILSNIYIYPFIISLKKINLFGFIERIELIFSLNYLYCFFFLLLLSSYQIYYQIKKIFKRT